jgi:hypothetical protein
MTVNPYLPGFPTTNYTFKLHPLFELRISIPSFIHGSGGKMHYAMAIDLLMLSTDGDYVMDRGNEDFSWL